MAIMAHMTSRPSSRNGLSCTIESKTGRFCDSPAWPDAPFPICRHHAIKLYIAMRGIHEGAFMKDMTMTPTVDPYFAVTPENVKRDTERWEAKKAEHSVVYYVRIGEFIKIGYTTNLRNRMSGLRTDCSNVLATEPGGKELEAKRHAQFDKIRVGRREDFKPTLALIKHIEAVRDFHGDPVFRNGRGQIVAA